MATIHSIHPEKAQAGEQRALHARAMDNLAFIRDTMEAAGTFTAVSGWGMAATGVIALIAAPIAAMQPSMTHWLYVWLTAAVLAPMVQLWAIASKSRASGVPLLTGPGRKFVLVFSPSIVAGGLLTVSLWHAGFYEMLPALWLLLYGAAVIAGGAFSVEILPIMGFCFMLAGFLAFLTPDAWNDWIMAASFGLMHIIFGVAIARRHGG